LTIETKKNYYPQCCELSFEEHLAEEENEARDFEEAEEPYIMTAKERELKEIESTRKGRSISMVASHTQFASSSMKLWHTHRNQSVSGMDITRIGL